MSNSDVIKQIFLPYQVKWLEDRSPIKIWEKSRRIGATFVQAFEDVRDIVEGTVPAVWFTSADESAAKEYILYCGQFAQVFNTAAKIFDETIIDDEKKDIKTLVIEFKITKDKITKKRRITALSSNPKGFRSKGGKVVWDEAAFHEQDRELWKAAKPATTWGFPIRILSTHHGKKSLYFRLVEDIKNGKSDWSLHTVSIKDAVEQGLFDKIKGQLTTEIERTEWIAGLKKDCRDDTIFNEEYMCIPVDESTAFIPYDLYFSCEQENILWQELPNLMEGDLYLGMDIGRTKDLSVIWIDQKLGDLTYARKIIVMEKTPFPKQREVLYHYLSHPIMRRGCIDASGMGRQLAEEAQADFGQFKVEPVIFTNTVKEEMGMYLKNRMQDRRTIVPASEVIRNDFHAIERSVTASGAIRLDADRTEAGHSDHFWAKALSENASRNYSSGPPVVIVSKRKRSSITENY